MTATSDERTLSVVMPTYNEEGAIEAAVEDIRRDVFNLLPTAELIVVNDGSKDSTGKILDQIAQREPRLRVVHQPNGGHGRALRRGCDEARGQYLFLLDSDREIPVENFPPLWELARTRDGAFGVRRQRADPPSRRILTRSIRNTLRALFGVRVYDANVPFKILKREIWLAARPIIPEETLAPSLFLGIFAKQRGYDIAERDVPHVARTTGVVSIRYWKLIKFCARGFRQLLAFRRNLGRLA